MKYLKFVSINETESIPNHPVVIFKKDIARDKRPSFGIAINSPRTFKSRYTDPTTFIQYENVEVRTRHIISIRFPRYARFLFNHLSTNVPVNDDFKNKK